MFVGTAEAGKILGISSQRVPLLLKQGRIQGAKKIARVWVIPLYNEKPRVTKGKRGRMPPWQPTRHCPLNTVHINRQSIGYNQKRSTSSLVESAIRTTPPDSTAKPVVSVKRGTRNQALGHEGSIHGPCRVVYRPQKPHDCGATVWIETLAEVRVYPLEAASVTIRGKISLSRAALGQSRVRRQNAAKCNSDRIWKCDRRWSICLSGVETVELGLVGDEASHSGESFLSVSMEQLSLLPPRVTTT